MEIIKCAAMVVVLSMVPIALIAIFVSVAADMSRDHDQQARNARMIEIIEGANDR